MTSRKKPSKPAQLIPLARTHEPIHGVRVGRVTGIDAAGIPLVEFAGNPTGHPLPARTTLALSESDWREAARTRQEAVLVFDGGEPLRPLITGLVQEPRSAPRTEALLATVERPKAPLQVREVDGRLFLEASKEITLECGKARVTLQRDGTVLVRGVRIESRASGPQLIRGGKIELN